MEFNQIKTNKLHTPLTEKYLNDLGEELKELLLDYVVNVEFIRNLTNPNRKKASDLPRWDLPHYDKVDDEGNLIRKIIPKGRIRVDLENPHILEDTDYFRQAGITWEKTGKYTNLTPSRNPYSDYSKFWKEEARRCREGYVRESDGEWVTGYHYFYLNYSPIMKSVVDPETKRTERLQRLPDFYDGDYWFLHYIERARINGQHTVCLKKRGAGYSLKGGSQLARNFILGETEKVNKNVVSLAIANEREYLTKDGILNKFIDVVDFCGEHTPFPRRRELKDSWQSMTWMMGYKDPETGAEKGTKNQVMGITLKNDPERARGKRCMFMIWEEFGKFSDSLKAWGIGRPSVEDGELVFGQMSAFGTGGTATAAFHGLRELFYNPKGYNVYGIKNVFDKKSKGSLCGYFHAGYLNQVGYMDKDGNSDVVGGLVAVLKKRLLTKYNSSDPSALTQAIAEMALTPQEAIMKVGGSIFNTVAIKAYLEECRINVQNFTSHHSCGDLLINDKGNVEFKPNFDKIPIRTYQAESENREGCIEIFSFPSIEKHTGKPKPFRYIAGIDPIDTDFLKAGSLGSIIIFDLWTDEIVAEYTGRPQLSEDFYEICRRLLLYYNAQGNYENNLKGLFGYFNNKNSLHLLADTPEQLRDIEQQRYMAVGNRAKGTRTTNEIINEGLRLQLSWMSGESYKYDDATGEEYVVTKLQTIRSLGYLEELYEFNPDGNFDRISAMNMVMLLRQERHKITEIERNTETSPYEEEDEFIRENYDLRFLNKID